MPKTSPREETTHVGPRKANGHLEIRAHSNMNQTGKAEERNDLVHFLRQVHCTENRIVMDKVVMTELPKAHQNLLVEVRQEQRKDDFL